MGGCAAQKDRDLVRERAPWVDVVLGTHNIDRLLDLMDHAQEWGPVTDIVEELEEMPSALPVRREIDHAAWVTIQVGCNNTCTFCIVPSVRGKEMSRRPGDIIREIERFADEGVVEVTLLGQNVNTYGRDLAIDGKRRPIFAELLRRVGEVEGMRRIRYTSPASGRLQRGRRPGDGRDRRRVRTAPSSAPVRLRSDPGQDASWVTTRIGSSTDWRWPAATCRRLTVFDRHHRRVPRRNR